jgi:DNA-binding NtrC family response regulator
VERVLIVDDDKDLQFNISSLLRDEGYEATTVGDGRNAIKEVKTKSPDLVLLDIRLPGMDGMKILEEIKSIDKDLIVIMLTAYADVKQAVKAMRLGAFDYITKPFDNEEFILVIKKALETQCLSKEVEILRKRLGKKAPTSEVMGESPAIKKVLQQVDIIAPTNMTVILQGASGTGKELIAQMIHQKSVRKDKPFVAVDCGAIPETLVESELFGYEKGAFTGADEPRQGKFEQANGGTLLLDEITNLSDSMQVKFLRVIEARKLQHLGGRRDIKIDVRIIVATNTNLIDVVRAGRFRDDLYHRLNEFCISLPLLRERNQDIPILAKYFLDEANRELNKKIKGFSSDAMKSLLNYSWPGNVRELKNLVKKVVLLTELEYIPRENLSTNSSTAETVIENPNTSFKDKTKEFEKRLLEEALEKSGGNKIKAARLLEMNRMSFYRKMKDLGLSPASLSEKPSLK